MRVIKKSSRMMAEEPTEKRERYVWVELCVLTNGPGQSCREGQTQ
jgi:hypothetical protein